MLQDIKFGLKLLWKHKAFSLAALLTLALCIGANTAVFTVLNTIILKSLPFPEAERVVTMYNIYPVLGVERGANGVLDYLDRRKLTDVFEEVALIGYRGYDAGAPAASAGLYRLPYADRVRIKVFDDFLSHRPVGRIDFFGIDGKRPYRVVVAAAGRIVTIQDGFSEQQSGRAAKDCRNNFVWIAHPNGEWTNYSHLARGSVSKKAGLRVGDRVEAGQYLGDEGAVGCAMLDHLHFEVAVPAADPAIDAGGFLLDNEGGRRERRPRFCGVAGGSVVKGATYVTRPCPET